MAPEDEDLKARIAALEADLRRERALFAGGPVVVFRWVAQPGWPVEYVSRNVEGLFGWPAEALLDGTVPYAALVHPDDLERVSAEVEAHSAAGESEFEQDYRIVRADGAVRWLYDFTVVIRDAEGATTHYDGYVLDISSRIEAEASIRRKDEELRQAQKVEALGRLAGGIAHDFNNLLTAVNGHAELAEAVLPAGSPALRPLARIRASVDRAAALTRQLLAFSRRQVLAPEVLDLRTIAGGALALVRPVLGEAIETRFSPGSEVLPVRVDPSQLEQVVVNLALNGRDAMPEGGVLSVTLERRHLSAPLPDAVAETIAPGDYAVLAVRDEGMGMDAATLARVFEPFFTTKGGRGTGLGLATVHGIVRQSGGGVSVRSAPGSGSTFEVYLPLANTLPRPQPAAIVRERPAAGTETILLVEDQVEIRNMLQTALSGAGYRVIPAANGIEALALARTSPIHLVLSDVVMPNLGGPALVERLVAEGIAPPVLFVSGFADHPVPEEPGRVSFLQKPFSTEELLREVRALLDPVDEREPS